MRFPALAGQIERRLLVNFRVDPDALERLLPSPFRPQRVNGHGLAGICLIRLAKVAPDRGPRWLGLTFESAAHRIAVEWNDEGEVRTGVYIPRRDTSSLLAAAAGGRIFPGIHHRSDFTVTDRPDRLRIEFRSRDGSASALVDASPAAALAPDSAFRSLDQATRFFSAGSVGFSPQAAKRGYDGLELRCAHWQLEPQQIREVQSSFFDDSALFPRGSVEFDSALLMRDVPHQWRRYERCPAPDVSS